MNCFCCSDDTVCKASLPRDSSELWKGGWSPCAHQRYIWSQFRSCYRSSIAKVIKCIEYCHFALIFSLLGLFYTLWVFYFVVQWGDSWRSPFRALQTICSSEYIAWGWWKWYVDSLLSKAFVPVRRCSLEDSKWWCSLELYWFVINFYFQYFPFVKPILDRQRQ
jgi:hypothetical protein